MNLFSRYRHEIVIYNNKIYVLGGGTASECDGFVILYAFDLKKKIWHRLKTSGDDSQKEEDRYPKDRKCHSCVQINECKLFSN